MKVANNKLYAGNSDRSDQSIPKEFYRVCGVMGARGVWGAEAPFKSDIFDHIKNYESEKIKMLDKITMIKNRIALLESRTGVDNKNIIAKLRRKIRALEAAL